MAETKVVTCRRCGEEMTIAVSCRQQLCDACRANHHRSPHKILKQKSYAAEGMTGENLRNCHDCGKPCVDYRCPKCWEKHRAKYGGSAKTTCSEDNIYLV